jgi:MoaA/NifB/PqqE/SkfB family radical SAM enzyme
MDQDTAISSLAVQVTSRCNRQCVHCYSPRAHDGKFVELPIRILSDIAHDAALLGLDSVVLLGGEPLIRADIVEVVRVFSGHGLSVDIATNGLLLNQQMLIGLRDAGLGCVAISIDGFGDGSSRMHGGKHFDQLINCLESVRQIGLRVRVSTVATSLNLSELEPLADALDGWCDLHKINFYTPAGPAGTKIWLGPQVWTAHSRSLRSKAADGTRQTPLEVQDPFVIGEPQQPVCRLVAPFIDANGETYPCVVLLGTSMSIGSVRRNQFSELWQSEWHFARTANHCIGYSQLLGRDPDYEYSLDLAIPKQWTLTCPLLCTRKEI